MAAFDEDWWNLRTQQVGRFDLVGVPTDGAGHVTWMRWRLIDELLQRFYANVGLEPLLGLIGTELYQVALASPTCLRAPRYFGRLCGTGVHADDESGMLSPLGDVELAWAQLGRGSHDHPQTWDTWTGHLKDMIGALGLAGASVPGHEGCFHRRGKSLAPLMYRLALLLRTGGGRDLTPQGDAMLTVVRRDGPSSPPESHEQVVDVIVRAGGDVPTGPPRFIGVRDVQGCWIAVRNDGWLATPQGTIDCASLWRERATVEETAGAVGAA
ncbi:MAG: hypothetical protein JJE52_01545 [Acidimicrobiia bacterium]|nr:hypothetical protein [Acidimicrobiia bacterium]